MNNNQIGRLILSSKNTYKFNNKPAKLCIILSDNNTDVLINTNKEFNTQDNYVLVDIINKKIIDNYGYVGIDTDDLNIYHHLHTYFWSSNTKLYKYMRDFDFSYDIEKLRESYDDIVITIDPLDSTDLDDGFTLNFNGDIVNLDIHIADPTSYFDFEKEYTWKLIEELSSRISTCYIPIDGKIKHLLPEININGNNLLELSTLIGKNKRAISFCFDINIVTGQVNMKIKKTILNNILNNTYENYDKKINEDIIYKNKLINLCDFMIKKIICNVKITDSDKINFSHKLIEIFMIWTNYYAGEYLSENKNKMFVRTQEKYLDINTKIPEYAKSFLNVGAKYNYVDFKNDNIYYHYSLGIKNYCHVTSPMRRFIDMVNHLLLHNLDNKEEIYYKFIKIFNTDEINNTLSKYKKLANGYEILKHLKINNTFKCCIFDKLDNNKVLIVIYDEIYNFKKIIKTVLPTDFEKINKYDEITIQIYYDSFKFKSKSLPFYIKILE
jgi:exoribonuclease R